ncbi:hypothetical protein [Hasllibacter sp. MH4015]|uniref:hypothetical protein n=1 Tax=Hasllibacter sp. MH4015 TaxID=2854029 RepID=UPI001CD2AA81|nr:hypothetical protein [Hasllibacter sp. MH4015]
MTEKLPELDKQLSDSEMTEEQRVALSQIDAEIETITALIDSYLEAKGIPLSAESISFTFDRDKSLMKRMKDLPDPNTPFGCASCRYGPRIACPGYMCPGEYEP